MWSSLVVISIVIALINACSYDFTFGQGRIEGIKLDSEESQALLLQLSNGIYDYCRKLNLQSGTITYEEISCTKHTGNFETFPEYDIELTFDNDAEAFKELNETEQVTIIEESDDTNITITMDSNYVSIMLQDIFIHPIYYSYFYSPSMKTLFIFTADQNESAQAIDDFTQINLVTISWDPTGSGDNDFPEDITKYVVGEQMNVNGNNFVGDAAESVILLDGNKWTTYEDNDMFMVEVASVISSCDEPEWFRYNYLPDIYQARVSGNDGGINGTFTFDHAGHGYQGVDPRLNRAFSFGPFSIHYYESDGKGFENFRLQDFEFDNGELSSYWVLMWFLIAMFVCCCCLCCGCYIKRKRDQKNKENQFGMTRDQIMMTEV